MAGIGSRAGHFVLSATRARPPAVRVPWRGRGTRIAVTGRAGADLRAEHRLRRASAKLARRLRRELLGIAIHRRGRRAVRGLAAQEHR